MTLRLHCFGESGHSYKVALALNLAELDWTPVYVDFFKGGTRAPEHLALNEMGECPVLEDAATTLTQSGVILDHLSEKTGRFGLHDPAIRRDVLRWVLWDNHKMSSMVGITRFLMNFVPEAKRPAEVIGWAQGRCAGAYKTLDAALAGRDWLVGDSVTAADLSCCSYLYYDEPFGFDRAAFPNIDRWLDGIAALPGWKHPYDLMPRAYGVAA
ncbi:glutathione S-transferase family protein [Dinoroseobacter sp. S124A]|uniref:glutathione S-transferase family protein n=1 Tax=Dinoroseobacter sp. S124A TaxID=3415128 RepID=UPI003C7CF4A1